MPGAAAFPYPYSELKVYRIRPEDMQPTEVTTKGITLDIKIYTDEPGATTGVEDFRPADEVDWSFYHDEVQYITKGRAEITYSLPPLHTRWHKTTAEVGCIYLIPRGARLKFKVIGNEPYRHVFVVMPGGFYPRDEFDR